MMQTKRIAPANSIIFISDSSGGRAPGPAWGAQTLSTSSCISLATYPEIEGETEIILGSLDEVDPGTPPDVDQAIDTKRKDLVVSTVDRTHVLHVSVPSSQTRVLVWRSEPEWPRRIVIGWSSGSHGD